MTSDVENIMSVGMMVRKDGPDKAIGVDPKNLMPNEKGEVPLSKQGAFIIEPVVAAPQPEEEVESLDLNVAQDGIITESPVDVANPSTLDGFGLVGALDNLSKPAEEPAPTPAPIVEEQPKPAVEMPSMPEEVVAEAPTTVSDDLFVAPTLNVSDVLPGVSQPTTDSTPTETPMATPFNVVDSQPAVAPTPEFKPEQIEEETIELHNPLTEDVSEELNRAASETSGDSIETVETVEEPVLPEMPTPEVKPTETVEEAPAVEASQPKLSTDKITALVEDFRAKINSQVDELERSINEMDLSSDKGETLETPEAPIIPTEPVINNPGFNSELPQSSELLNPVPTPEAPVTPAMPVEDDMVDALSQIGNVGIDTVDETPIQGKFI